MSSEFNILYSLPFSLISVPPYLLINTRSPFLTSNGTFLPLSSVLPVPSATMSPSVGFFLGGIGDDDAAFLDFLLLVHDFCINDRTFVLRLLVVGLGFAGFGLRLAFAGTRFFRRCLVKLG